MSYADRYGKQIVAGDMMVDEARDRDGDRVSVGYLIKELDREIRETVSEAR